MSKLLLQIVVVLLSLLPLSFGLLGIVFGTGRYLQKPGGAQPVNADLDSQFRFLSAWYLGLAVIAWWMAADIEAHTTLFRIVCVAVFVGGLARLVSIAKVGRPTPRFIVVMVAELLFPLLIVWQASVAKGA